MGRYLAIRAGSSVLVLFGISILLFGMLQVIPGDPVDFLINPTEFAGDRTAATVQLRHRLGLDRPVLVQYVDWLREVVGGNLGYSMSKKRPVLEVLANRLPPTLRLMGAAVVIALVIAVPAGIAAALRRNTIVDYAVSGASLVMISVPSFFTGLLAIYVFGLRLQWFPTSGMHSSGGGGVTDALWHLVLPATILGLAIAGPFMRYVRTSFLEVLGRDFLLTAKSKGVPRTGVIARHAMRNALPALITVLALQLPVLFAGATVTEKMFAWPGMGRLAVDSITARDYPLLLAFVMVVAVSVVLCNFLADVSYALIDPRVRL